MNIDWIGWCNTQNHDKIWGVIDLGQSPSSKWHRDYLFFWGKRTGKLQTKIITDLDYSIKKTIDNKNKKKKYREVSKEDLSRLDASFTERLEKTITWALLKH